jgi:hypothetical protein
MARWVAPAGAAIALGMGSLIVGVSLWPQGRPMPAAMITWASLQPDGSLIELKQPTQAAEPSEPTEPSASPGSVQPEPNQTDGRDDGVQEAIVLLHTGRELSGVLVSQNDESVVLSINGIETTLPRDRVARVRLLAPVEERYAALRATVSDSDIRSRLALVEWLRARRAYDLALGELEGILERDPANPDARTLENWLRNHLRLRQQPAAEPTARAVPPAPSIPRLTEAQINRIRVYEIDLTVPIRVIVPDEVLRELMVRFPGSFPVDIGEREAMMRREPIEKLRLIFERRARDLYDRVRVLEDPPVMATFKSRIHGSGGWLVNACASNRCHGGADAGRLSLLNQRVNTDETAYTNFLILDRFRLADGTPLINHGEPARSPLIHMALPRQSSLYPHPPVDRRQIGQDWRFVFRTTEDRRFRETADWIASLYQPRPDYDIVYPPAKPPADPPADPLAVPPEVEITLENAPPTDAEHDPATTTDP